MRHTIEEKMMTLKERKQELFRAVVEHGESASPAGAAALTAEDFRYLLADGPSLKP
jgi:SNF2 family DNA or RNA helicase